MRQSRLIDIVIINWSAQDQLDACLWSLTQGDNSSIASIRVVDNSHNSQIGQDLINMLSIKVLRPEKNLGFGSGCNYGAAQGKADFILFLNPDIQFFNNTIENLVAFISSKYLLEDVGIIGVRLIGQDGNTQKNVARFPQYPDFFPRMLGLDRLFPKIFSSHFVKDMDYGQTQIVDQVPGGFFLVRRRVFEELVGFDERFFMYYEDVDFSYRAYHAGWKTLYFADVTVRHSGGGTTGQIKGQRLFYSLRSRVQYTGKHFGRKRAVWLAVGILFLEFPARLLRSLVRISLEELKTTFQAKRLFLRQLKEVINSV